MLSMREISRTVLSRKSAFTLIELLITVAIVAIISVVVIMVLNPPELLNQARDSTRLNDLYSLRRGIELYSFEQDLTGNASTTYTSLVDPNATTTAGTNCSNLNLPAQPVGWSYHCVASSTMKKIDGTGWVPLDFTSLLQRPFGALPVDPTNTSSSGLYYTFARAGNYFTIGAQLISTRYSPLQVDDGGYDHDLMEMGNTLSVSPKNPGLIGWWKFDDGSGASAADSSGNGNTGALSASAPTWTTGHLSGGLSFNGSSNYVRITSTRLLQTDRDVTISLWYNITSLGSRMALIHKYTYNEYNVQVNDSAPYIINWFHGDGTNYDGSYAINSTNSGVWHHLVITRDIHSRSVTGYYDCNLSRSFSYTTQPSKGNIDVYIGSRNNGTEYFNGVIDQVRIYNRVLTSAEIQSLCGE